MLSELLGATDILAYNCRHLFCEHRSAFALHSRTASLSHCQHCCSHLIVGISQVVHGNPLIRDGRQQFEERWWKGVVYMRKTTKMSNEDLKFVQKYCLAGTFPASDERCPYAKAKLLAGFPESPKGESDFREADAMFLCRYPDQEMPTHEARLISELNQCPNTERREKIDEVGVANV